MSRSFLKHNRRLALSLVASGLAFCFGRDSQAANQSWNPGGAGGGAGSWNANNWDSASTWSSGNTAVFAGTPGAVTLNSTTQTVGGLTFGVGGYSLSNGTLALSGAPTIIATTSGTTSFASTLFLTGAAGAQVTKTGAGTLLLNGANGGLGTTGTSSVWTITGGTLVNGVYDSILSVNGGNNLGALPGVAAVQAILDAGTLITTGNIGANRSLQVNPAGGTLQINTTNSADGKIFNNADSGHAFYVGVGAGFVGTLNGVVSGTGSLVKIDAGTLVINGADTYSGGTTLTTGTLNIGNASALGASTGALAVNGGVLNLNGLSISVGDFSGSGGVVSTGTAAGTSTLTVNASANSTYAGVISNNGNGVVALAKTGLGSLALSGSNSYSGATTLSSGTLTFSNANAVVNSTLTMQGGNLVFDSSVGAHAFNLGGLASTTGTRGVGYDIALQDNASNPVSLIVGGNNASTEYDGVLSGAGSLTKVGNGTLFLVPFNTASSFSGGVVLQSGTLKMWNSGALGTATASSLEFSGNGALQIVSGQASVTWTSTKNMKIDSGVTAVIDTQNSNVTIGSIISGANGALTKVGTGGLTLSGSNTFSGNTLVSSGTLVLSNNQALQNSAIDTSGTGVVSLSVTTPTFGGLLGSKDLASVIASGYTGAVTGVTLNPGAGVANSYSGVISDGASGMTLTKTGAGTQTLSGINTYTGATTISSGTLQISDGSIATSSAISNSGALVFNLNANAAAYGNVISGAGSLTKLGTNTLTLTGSNTYTGTTTISAGTMQLGDGTAGHDGAISGNQSIVNNSTLAFDNFAAVGYSGVISGSGALTKIGNSGLSFTGTNANTYTGVTTVSGGGSSFLNLGKTAGVDAIAGNITLGVGSSAGAVQLLANDQIKDTSIVSLDGTVSGSRGVLRMNGFSDTIGGLVSVITGGGVVDDFANPNSTLTLNVVSGTLSYSGQIRDTASASTGALAIVKTGAGTQIISSQAPLGTNAYTGGTQINGGVLQVAGTNALGASGAISFGGGTLQYAAGGTATDYSGRIKNSAAAIALDTNNQSVVLAGNIDSSNTGGLAKSGAGNLTLSANNTYTGATTVNAGKLVVSGSLSGSTSVTVAAGATLELDNSAQIVTSGTVGVNGTLALKGSSTLGKLILGNGSTLAISGSSVGSFGKVSVTNGLSLSGSTAVTLSVDSTGYNPGYTLGDLSLSDKIVLTLGGYTPGDQFANVVSGFSSNYNATLNLYTDSNNHAWAVFYGVDSSAGYQSNWLTGTNGGSDIVLLAIPEPQSLAMIISGFGVLIGFQKMRKPRVGAR